MKFNINFGLIVSVVLGAAAVILQSDTFGLAAMVALFVTGIAYITADRPAPVVAEPAPAPVVEAVVEVKPTKKRAPAKPRAPKPVAIKAPVKAKATKAPAKPAAKKPAAKKPTK